LSEQRTVKQEEAADFAARNKLIFLEISAMMEGGSVE
jgi:hypothetical protein